MCGGSLQSKQVPVVHRSHTSPPLTSYSAWMHIVDTRFLRPDFGLQTRPLEPRAIHNRILCAERRENRNSGD